jgi:hypothetical protein
MFALLFAVFAVAGQMSWDDELRLAYAHQQQGDFPAAISILERLVRQAETFGPEDPRLSSPSTTWAAPITTTAPGSKLTLTHIYASQFQRAERAYLHIAAGRRGEAGRRDSRQAESGERAGRNS